MHRSLVHPLQQRYDTPLIDTARLMRDPATLRADLPVLMAVHSAIKAALERARSDKVLGSSLQSSAVLSLHSTPSSASSSAKDVLSRYADELEALFVVSSIEVCPDADVQPPFDASWSYVQEIILGDDVASAKTVLGSVHILPPKQAKCPRCWRYVAPAEDVLCGRCEDVVKSQ